MSVSTFGDTDAPAILLIAGAGSSMDWWPPEFCTALASDRFVIRYDHRDTGDAPSHPPGEPGYTGDDLVADAVAVLDEVGAGAAHVVGISMGGALAQEVALRYPDRVRSLTLISTSLVVGRADLPGSAVPPPPPEPDWTDDAAVVEYLVAAQRALAAEPFDDEEWRAIARIAVSRTTNNESGQKNHYLAEGAGPLPADLSDITVPTVVLHGDADPLFPLPHGEALAREIPHARLVVLPHTGHELPRRNWPVVVAEVLALTAG